MNRLTMLLLALLAAGCATPQPDWPVIKPTNWIGWPNQPPVPRAVSEVLVLWDAPINYVDGTAIDAPITYTLYVNGVAAFTGLTENAAIVALPPPPEHKLSIGAGAIVNGWESDMSDTLEIKKPQKPGKPQRQ